MSTNHRVAAWGIAAGLAIAAATFWLGRDTQHEPIMAASAAIESGDSAHANAASASAHTQRSHGSGPHVVASTQAKSGIAYDESVATMDAALAAAMPVMQLIPTKLGPMPSRMADGRRIELVNGYPVAANRVLVRYRADAGASVRAAFAARAGAVEVKGLAGPTDRMYLIDTYGDRSVERLVRELSNDPNVQYVQPDHIVRATAVPNDPSFSGLWGLSNTGQTIAGQAGTVGVDIGAAGAWDFTKGSSSIVVGVVDTGVDYNHPDLVGNVWSAPSAFTVTFGGQTLSCAAGSRGLRSGFGGASCNPMDDQTGTSCSAGVCFYGKHGTHVSGTIGARGNNGQGVTGVNWTTSIIGLKFLDFAGNGYTSDAINVLEGAIQIKQKGLANIRVLNNSWGGGGTDPAVNDIIAKANANGILFVSAAGNANSNNDTSPVIPGSIVAANTINVAASDNRDARASFSNYGRTTVHLSAPGVGILSTVGNGGQTYFGYNGTSMASPHVAGAAALVMAACPGLDIAGVKAALLNNVDATGAMSTITIAGGRLNVRKAIASCSGPFYVSGSPSVRNIGPGKSTTYTVTLGRNGGFNGTVNLSVTGLPGGATASFSPASFAGTTAGNSTLTVNTTTATPLGNYTLTIRGASGSTVSTSTVTLQVAAPNFTLNAGPASRLIKPGQSGGYSVDLSSVGSFGGTVSLSVAGLPGGATAGFSPTSIANGSGSSTMTVNVGAGTAEGLYTLTVTGSGGGLTRSTTVRLEVRRPSFTMRLSNGATVRVKRQTFHTPSWQQLEVTPTYGFTGTVNTTLTGLPPNTTLSGAFGPIGFTNPNQNWAGYTSTSINVTPTTPLGIYTLTYTVSGGGISKSVTQRFEVY